MTTPTMPHAPRRAAVLAAALLACATSGRSPLEAAALDAESSSASGRELALAGFHAWLDRDDAASAAARIAEAIRRDPRDPIARLGAAWLARRRLDDEGEMDNLLALLDGAPSSPLAPVAARRLAELADTAPVLARRIAQGLDPLLARRALPGLAAYRARVALAAAAEALGDLERASRARADNGTVIAWTLAGPCGAYHALEIDRPFPPEQGPLPARFPSAPGLPPVEPRPLPAPDGIVGLEGEPPTGDIYYLASDVDLARGGRYLVSMGATTTLKAWLDGEPILERRAYAGFPPSAVVIPRALASGRHRLLVKIGRGAGPASASVSLAREDGAASDGRWSPAAIGQGGAVDARARPPRPVGGPRALAERLEPTMGRVLARLVAARDAVDVDRETAKALLDEALALAPASAMLHAARGDALRDDPTLADRVAHARAESEYDAVLGRDPGDAATRLERAELMRVGERLDDAQALLSGLAPADGARPRALVLRARIASARGFTEGAERLADEARRHDGDCRATELVQELAARREAIARADEMAEALSLCRGGRERLALHRHLRGDLAGELAIRERLVGAAPARVDLRLAYARALLAHGDPAAAVRQLDDLARLWPRDAHIEKQRADALELAGDRAGARTARERALLLDGTDLALRRALALDDGTEVLATYAEDGRKAIAAYEAAAHKADTSGVTVLDAAAVEVLPGGGAVERVHEVIQVLDQRGVERFGEVAVPHGAEIISVRAIKKDGRVFEQEDTGERHAITLPGLEPGDYIEYEYLHAVPPRGPGVPGFTAEPFYFRVEGMPLWRSSYVVAAPKGTGLEVDAHHMSSPNVKQEGDREVVRAVATQVPALVDEPGDIGASEYLPFVQVGAGASREAMQLALADALVDRARPSHEVVQLARAIAAQAAKDRAPAKDALLRAAYARVNETVLGTGGGWVEGAGAILSSGRGNRTILLKAVYAALGVKARIALVRGFANDPAPYRFPRPDLYSYPVLRVEHGGQTVWLDPTTRFTPYGVLPGSIRGCEALVLPEPGELPEVVRTPDADPGDEGRKLELRIALSQDGSAIVEAVEQYLGYDGAAVKASLEKLDIQSRRQIVEQGLARSFRGLELQSFEIEGESRAETPVTLRYRVRVPQLVRFEGGEAVLDAPLQPIRLGARFLSLAARETPLLIGAAEKSRVRVAIVPPAGFKPAPGEDREVGSQFGRYVRHDRTDGSALVREEQFLLARGRVAPDSYAAFARFASAVDDAQEATLRFRR